MNNSRRGFLKNSSMALAGSMLLTNDIFAERKISKQILGLQLYSVRDEMTADPSGTLKQLAEMGYKYVEHANYVEGKFYGYSPTEFKKVLDDLKLVMVSGHTTMHSEDWDDTKKDFTDKWKKTVEDAAILEQKYMISPWLDESMRTDFEGLKSFLDKFNKCGTLCKKSGMKFGYHNHNFEFSTKLNDMTLYDLILKYTDPQLVAQQLDIGNMYGTGGSALAIIKKYPGRFELMHVKDEIKSAKGEMKDPFESAVLGTGLIGVKEILDLSKKSGGTTQFIIEQESYQTKTPLQSVKEDLEIMKKWGYS